MAREAGDRLAQGSRTEEKRTTLGIKSSSINNMIGQGCMSFSYGSDMDHMRERQYEATLNSTPLPIKLCGWRCDTNERNFFHMLKG